MAIHDPTLVKYAGPVPGHVRAMLATAAGVGLSARVLSDADARDDLIVCVTGPAEAFRQAGFVDPKLCFPVRRSYHFSRLYRWEIRRIAGDDFEATSTFDAPHELRQLEGSVELATYPDTDYECERRGLWGDVAAVETVAGLRPGELKPPQAKKRRPSLRKDGSHQGRRWLARYYPTGVFYFEERTKRPVGEGRSREETYDSPEKFARSVEGFLRAATKCVVAEMSGELERKYFGQVTIRYDSQTVDAVGDALDHACQLLQAAVPGFVARKRDELRRLESARADTDFQAFMAEIN